MFEALLLFIFSLFVFITGYRLVKVNILFGGSYFFLFIYSIFVQIGYQFFPEVATIAQLYFGEEYFLKFYVFNFLSFISFYILCKFTILKQLNLSKYKVIRVRKTINFFFFAVVISFIIIFLSVYFAQNYQAFNYANASDPDFIKSQGTVFGVFGLIFKRLAPLTLIVYMQWRLKKNLRWISDNKKISLSVLFVLLVTLLIVISNKQGNRTDLLAFIIGLTVFEFQVGFNVKKAIKFLGFLSLFVFMLIFVETSRSHGVSSDRQFVQLVLLQDYFGPAHMLYAAMSTEYIQPLEVIISNVSNSLMALKYPYLQEPLTNSFNPGAATRSRGYGFYLFTEGFIFMGYAGFLYNAITLYLGLYIWNYIASSDNKYYNIMIMSILCTQFANIARSQSSYFIKDIYVMFIPFLILIYWSSGLRPKF